ncbi:MAG: hypothetical protein BGO76_00405 [Caedibacter sp. 38-128]|nr:hypothetical protein [Holosporales bacterium]OJX02932.1 MAG: hypothetical protein BGO76_00405 [Caedibacter sp. 38-128]
MIIKNNRCYDLIFKYYEMMHSYFAELAISLLHILMLLSAVAIFQLLIAKTITETALHLYTIYFMYGCYALAIIGFLKALSFQLYYSIKRLYENGIILAFQKHNMFKVLFMLCLIMYLLNINKQLHTQIKDKVISNNIAYERGLVDKKQYLDELKKTISRIRKTNPEYEILLKAVTDKQFNKFIRSELSKK